MLFIHTDLENLLKIANRQTH